MMISFLFLHSHLLFFLIRIIFEITLSATETLLSIDIEQIDSNERWSGQFTSQCMSSSFSSSPLILPFIVDLEELTHQVGNYKKYGVFIKMLISGFSGDSENVYVNLLTYNDLQLLKARKLGVSTSFSSQTSSQTFPSSSISSSSQSKRYIILTYASEFDRVNFPLPLSFEENPNVSSLQRTIKRLRNKLKDAQSIQHTSKER
jgi:coiled-coil domain-containing protein 61